MKTIMIVDDEPRLVTLLEAYLTQEGFHVVSASDGRQALEVARTAEPALIILDLMMPEMDGYDFMRLHRAERHTPIIILTARVEDEDQVLGLELGADDYVAKPFRPRELLARVRAVLRRVGEISPLPATLTWGRLRLDRDAHVMFVDDQPTDLTPSEFELMSALMSAPGKAFTRMELLERIQGVAYQGYERTIDVHVKNLRAKLGDDSRTPHFIQTVFGVGYRLGTG